MQRRGCEEEHDGQEECREEDECEDGFDGAVHGRIVSGRGAYVKGFSHKIVKVLDRNDVLPSLEVEADLLNELFCRHIVHLLRLGIHDDGEGTIVLNQQGAGGVEVALKENHRVLLGATQGKLRIPDAASEPPLVLGRAGLGDGQDEVHSKSSSSE